MPPAMPAMFADPSATWDEGPAARGKRGDAEQDRATLADSVVTPRDILTLLLIVLGALLATTAAMTYDVRLGLVLVGASMCAVGLLLAN